MKTMIRLTTQQGAHFVNLENIARISEAGVSSQWHGIRSFLKLFDGTTLECHETASDIAKQISDAAKEAP